VTPGAVASGRAVLVTGASGLVGRRVVELLAGSRPAIGTIIALDLRDPASGHLDGVEYESGDIRDPAIAAIFARHRIDTVVHLAAVVTPGRNSSRDFEYSIDVEGTRNVVEACLLTSVRHFVYTSSGAAYGFHADNPVPLRETDALRGNPEFAYAHHKRLVEEMLAGYRVSDPQLGQLILRPGTILGADVASPISAMFERPVVVGVAGSDIPFVLIWDEDVAACILHGILGERSGIYNLTGDGAVTLREIAHSLGKPYLALPAWLMQAVLGALHTFGISDRGGEQVDFLRYRPVLSNELLKREFGFVPSATSAGCLERYRRATVAKHASTASG